MNIINAFSSFIAIDDSSLLDNAVLEKLCRKKLTVNSNRLTPTQSQFTQQELQNELKPLCELVIEKINELHLQLGFSSAYSQEIKKVWCNVDNKYSTFFPHSHPGAFFSAVYYVKADADSGNLEFITPVAAFEHVLDKDLELVAKFNEYNTGIFKMPPKTGGLVIFPAWLHHYVNDNHSEIERFSIAFNTQIVKNDS